jgi:uncharacterized protein (TIGR02145 family)
MSGSLLKFQRTVKIGNHYYPFVKIGNQQWTTEHLDFVFDGLNIGDSSVDSTKCQAWYYDNDETTYGWNGQRRGLLYSGYTLVWMINHYDILFPEGWRIPSVADYNTLINFVGDTSTLNFPGGEDYDSWSGTNTKHFNCKPTGWCQAPYFYDKNGVGLVWTTDIYSSDLYYGKYFYPSTVGQNPHYLNRGGAIRLVKDIT